MLLTFRPVVFAEDDCLLLWSEVRFFELIFPFKTTNFYKYFSYFKFTDNMSEFIKNATDLIEQGHIRVGTEVVKDPAFLVSRTLEDFVTWVDSSKIRQHVMEYNNMVIL